MREQTIAWAAADSSLCAAVLQPEKGGNPQEVKDSQQKRNASVELVDEVLALYKDWTQISFQLSQLQRDTNAVQKEITARRKNKESADEEMKRKKELDQQVVDLKPKVVEAENKMKAKARTIGNIVGPKVPISNTEDDNAVLKTWHPDGPNGQVEKKT